MKLLNIANDKNRLNFRADSILLMKKVDHLIFIYVRLEKREICKISPLSMTLK